MRRRGLLSAAAAGVALPAPPARAAAAAAPSAAAEAVQAVRGDLGRARRAAAAADPALALRLYDRIIASYPDLAITEYARLGRAVALFEFDKRRSLLELFDESAAFAGYGEVHAALAVAVYTERPLERDLAEKQWLLATALDRGFEDEDYVRRRGWGEELRTSWRRFKTLT